MGTASKPVPPNTAPKPSPQQAAANSGGMRPAEKKQEAATPKQGTANTNDKAGKFAAAAEPKAETTPLEDRVHEFHILMENRLVVAGQLSLLLNQMGITAVGGDSPFYEDKHILGMSPREYNLCVATMLEAIERTAREPE